MENSKISSRQIFALIMIFELGTTVMFPLAAKAKQAAWISILIGMLGGIVLLTLYHYLFCQYTDKLLTEYCKRIFGKYIGTFICIIYVFYFLYGAARDIRDGMEILSLFYPETPISILGIMIMAIICYGLYLGIEVIGRMSEIFFGFLIISGLFFLISLIASGVIKVENLQPVLEPGWKAILRTAIDEPWMAPFGEMICFTMIFPYLNKPKSQFKITLIGVILSGIFLAVIHTLSIAVLGVEQRNRSIIPFFKMAQMINIGDFIQRLDAFSMIWLIVNDYFKITIYMYAAVMGGATIIKISKNVFILPMGAIVIITSIYFAGSYSAHMAQSDIVLKYVYPIFAAYIPLLMCVITFIKKKFRNSTS